eukprot:gnl/TRDRNA2_/TRDRNA2_173549_c6_seq5.p1 gnl/TRDRNA2_/TRDRNA2_173549_c6~~gnl/TRDRNA2_/TRDRNA2_173549_c6_seq5.p1  ORF type:complete len:280 (+),score=50.44 gnl/TRDRNA2_/TRDRNA2_173549_c6_seq5:85-840(+)
MVVARLRALFPDDAFIGEEGTTEQAVWPPAPGRVAWVIDPIDGTKNFLHGSPHCCVSIAAVRGGDGDPLVGVVASPLMGTTYWAVKNGGAWLDREATARRRQDEELVERAGQKWWRRRLHVSAVAVPSAAALTYDLNTRDPEPLREDLERVRRLLLLPVQTLRCHGSAALELCRVAAGGTEAHWERGLDVWDVAAGWLMVTEAGGTLCDFAGRHLKATAEFSGDLVASNGRPQILQPLLRCLDLAGVASKL